MFKSNFDFWCGITRSKHRELRSDLKLTCLNLISSNNELFGVPRQLFPAFLAFFLDAIGVGLIVPLLPFYLMDIGANAFELSLVISSNYVVQAVGCLFMGGISDKYGRKTVLLICLFASSLSNIALSNSTTLLTITLSRIICGSCGGLVPILQSCVSDSTNQTDHPKYLGRITATFGFGFVLGPILNSLLVGWSVRDKIRICFFFPLLGFLIVYRQFRETKLNSPSFSAGSLTISPSISDSPTYTLSSPSSSFQLTHNTIPDSSTSPPMSIPFASIFNQRKFSRNREKEKEKDSGHSISPRDSSTIDSTSNVNSSPSSSILSFPILLLSLNGFLLMFSFGLEAIYGVFIREVLGLEDQALSFILAGNGLCLGLFQVFFIKPIIAHFGKHLALLLGNGLLAVGLVGVALTRTPLSLHLFLFTVHVIGFAIGETSLVSLITKYSPPSSQGRALSLNQAAQASARMISPLLAGWMYEVGKKTLSPSPPITSTFDSSSMKTLQSTGQFGQKESVESASLTTPLSSVRSEENQQTRIFLTNNNISNNDNPSIFSFHIPAPRINPFPFHQPPSGTNISLPLSPLTLPPPINNSTHSLFSNLSLTPQSLSSSLPAGSLPFLVGSLFPALAMLIPLSLYLTKMKLKKSNPQQMNSPPSSSFSSLPLSAP